MTANRTPEPFTSSYVNILVSLKKALTGAKNILNSNPVLAFSIRSDMKMGNLQEATSEAKDNLGSMIHDVDNIIDKLRVNKPAEAQAYEQKLSELKIKVRTLETTVDTLLVSLDQTTKEVFEKNALLLGQVSAARNQEEVTKSATIHKEIAALQNLIDPLSTKTINTLNAVEDVLHQLSGIYSNVWYGLSPSIQATLPAPNSLGAAVIARANTVRNIHMTTPTRNAPEKDTDVTPTGGRQPG